MPVYCGNCDGMPGPNRRFKVRSRHGSRGQQGWVQAGFSAQVVQEPSHENKTDITKAQATILQRTHKTQGFKYTPDTDGDKETPVNNIGENR